jgi:hypothetical protein
LQLGVEALAELQQGGLILVRKEDLLGEQTVFESVEADGGLPFQRRRPGALAGVAPVGSDLLITGHNLIYLSFCVDDAKELYRRFPGSPQETVDP